MTPQGTTWTFGTTWTRGTTWPQRGTTWTRKLLAATVAAVLLSALTGPITAGAADRNDRMVEVIVGRVAGAAGAAERAVVAAGGEIVRRLDIIDGFTAEVPDRMLDQLRATPGVGPVSLNRRVELFDDPASTPVSNSLDVVRGTVGAAASGAQGVGVALVDTGIAQVDDIGFRRGPDTSGGNGRDGFGHGTHLAGIIGGTAADVTGVAAGADLISVATAKSNGETSLFEVLLALDWVVAHRAAAGIRVINLSLGVEPLANPMDDPLVAAVERAVRHGIVVVVAAGNRGEVDGAVTSPGYAPSAITVGASNPNGTPDVGDDTVPTFSPAGSAARRVDLVAPGASVVSVRAPGSHIDGAYPAARVGDRFRGSGTSQAAAVVTGVVANLLAQRPQLQPSQVKAVLKASATPLAGVSTDRQGAGSVNLTAALTAPAPAAVDPGPARPAPVPGRALGTDGIWFGNNWFGGSWGGGSWGGGSWGSTAWSGWMI